MSGPLTPVDCDLQDFPFMPLHVARLRDSDLAGEECPEACWYAVLLWAASWHQIPAASLPNNDAVLTKLIGLGRDIRTFRKHKAGALRGFVLCADGRLYHDVVAEQANESWGRKLQQRWRTECSRLKKRNQRDKTDLPMPTWEEFLATLPETSRPLSVPEDNTDASPGTDSPRPQGKGVQETGIGTETGTSTSEDKSSASDQVEDLDATGWKSAVTVLTKQGGMAEPEARRFFGKLLAQHKLLARDMLPSAAGALVAATQDPKGYLTRAAQGVARRRTEGAAPKRVSFV